MSIVITVVTKNVVVQVSDVRLTSLSDGKPLDKKQRKSVLVLGSDAAFVIGWTGFAESSDGQFKTGDWLFNTLNHIRAFEKPLTDIAGDLTGQADYAFNQLREPQSNKGCRFVLGGWHRKNGNAELFTVVIFNDLLENTRRQAHEPPLIESSTVSTQFKYLPGFFLPVEFPHTVHVTGSAKPEWIEDQMRVLRKVMDNQGGEAAITRACVDVARRAAGYTSTISKELIVAMLKKTGEFTTVYLPENDTESWLVPDVITPSGATTQGRIEAIFSGGEVSATFRAQVLKR
jgi:hypothetical protein